MRLTISKFKASKELLSINNTEDIERIINITGYENIEDNSTYLIVYHKDCYINAECKNKKWIYTLCICNEEWQSNDLNKLENILYNEHYIHNN